MKHLLFLCALLFSVNLSADNVTAEEAYAIATHFFSEDIRKTRTVSPQLQLIWEGEENVTRSADIHPAYYVFNRTDVNSFVIVAGDDTVYPILAYSKDHSFSIEQMPDNLKQWMNNYREQINRIRSSETYSSREKYTIYQNSSSLSTTRSEQETLLYTALWDQMTPYNILCPIGTNGNPTPTGCVATAFAIVMKYHQWPNEGNGELKEYTSKTLKKTLSATFNRSYAWEYMPNEYKEGEYSTKEGNNVAVLMYHCGVMSEMDYNTGASGALTHVAIAGLTRYMKYDKGASLLAREWYTEKEWENIIKTEISEQRPVIYGGSNNKREGHQFIVDGYNNDGYFHINWGWSGMSNGMFRLSALDPNAQGSGGNTGGGFSIGQDVVVGIKKDEGNIQHTYTLAFFSGKTSAGEEFAGLEASTRNFVPNQNFIMKAGFIGNYTYNNFSGNVAFALTNKNKEIREIISRIIPISSIPTMNGQAITDVECIIKSEIQNGDRIVMVYRTDNNELWKIVRGDSDTKSEIIVKPDIVGIADANISDSSEIIIYEKNNSITISSLSPITQILIYDMKGHILVDTQTNNSNIINIPCQLPKGVYIVKIITKEGNQQRKFIKQ